ncbi:acyl-CoA carboxylase subunit epsilon [Nocardioides lijunqiniae]|uniref:acyl-CoA carboxylase subunit epsilon n=1 Tax=Nocardioides lijunqiniae TaxID=2760832 RepID=UPI00187760FC|nr:acyl-CoA carboxylase subunit epsilon [Nocardioides lijunqiniae]
MADSTEPTGPTGPTDAEPARPLLRVVGSDATPEEIAALVAVLSSLGGDAAPAPRRTPEWSSHHRTLRRSFPHGPGAWRSSGLPR